MARILIIDDEEQVRDLLQGICQAEGYETVVAPNGKEGVKKIVASQRMLSLRI